ncbi:MAG: hypothetical protein HXY18_11405 [Bryobacteraceae bacterium]|nr:hypothetical protein [Bryobacteraceae bacterium]
MVGAADSDHDGNISYEELYQFVQFEVSRDFKQFPQLLQPATGKMSDRPAFGRRSTSVQADHLVAPNVVQVKLQGPLIQVRERLVQVPSVRLSDAFYDVLVEPIKGGYNLVHRSGNPIQRFEEKDVVALVDRIRAQADVSRLIEARFSRQDFNVNLEVMPETKGSYSSGERIRFQASAAREGCPVLCNIDVTGTVTVIYPRVGEAVERIGFGRSTALGEGQVLPPFGLEYLKLIVFRDNIEACQEWAGKVFSPGSVDFARFLGLLQSDSAGRAQVTMRLLTRGD